MERDPHGFLWDARESADAILRFIAGRSRDDYLTDAMLSAAVERHFEIIGEALNRLAKSAPAIAARIPDLRNAVALRNLLIHGYAAVDHGIVWRTAQEDLPRLRVMVQDLLTELGDLPGAEP